MGKTKASTTAPIADEAPPEYAAPALASNSGAPTVDDADALPPPPEYVRSVGAARWLEINLRICNVTACLMFIVGIINISFAGVVNGDLKDDRDAQSCSYNYIADADKPWVGRTGPGRYEGACRLLLAWAQVATAAGSMSMIGAFVLLIRARKPTFWAVRFSSGPMRDRNFPPSRVYLVRCAFSAATAMLYLAAIVMLVSTRIFTQDGVPRSGDRSYRQMMSVALGILGVSAFVSLHQAFCTGVAAFAFRGMPRLGGNSEADADSLS